MGLTDKDISFISSFVSRAFPDAPQVVDAAVTKDNVAAVCKCLVVAAGPRASQVLLGESSEVRAEVEQWLSFASAIHTDDNLKSTYLRTLDTYLISKSVFVGVGTSTSIADVALFLSIHDQVAALPKEELKTYSNLLRWIDYVQHKDDQSHVYEWIPVEKPTFNPPIPSSEPEVKKVPAIAQAPPEKERASTAASGASPVPADNKSAKKQESKGKPEATASSVVQKKVDDVNQKEKKVGNEPKDKKEPAPVQKDAFGFEILDIRVGIIESVEKHPSADTLYVEKINIGEGSVRQVVSGLAKFLTEEQMLNRRVLVLANVKPSKLRDVMSAGLVLCASNEDHTQCEPILPPQGASVGERVIVSGYEGKPEAVLNPKKKQWDKLYPDLHSDNTGVACYQGKPLMTTAGPCTTSITQGKINGGEEPEELSELEFSELIPCPASLTDSVVLQPTRTMTPEPGLPHIIQHFEADAWYKEGSPEFMTIGWFCPSDMNHDTAVEETGTISPDEFTRDESDSVPNVMLPTLGHTTDTTGGHVRIQARSPISGDEATGTAQNREPTYFFSGFGIPSSDRVGSFPSDEALVDGWAPCVLASLEIDPGATCSTARGLRWEQGLSELSGHCSVGTDENACCSLTSGTTRSWVYSPVSEAIDDGCDDSLYDEQLESYFPQEFMESNTVVVSAEI